MEARACDILLVEDNPADAELTVRALRRAKVANPVHIVEDGVEALAYLFGSDEDDTAGEGQTPRVVLLDLKLPKLSGLEVLRRIREGEKTRQLPVVVLTSSREEPDVEQAYKLGVNSYVVKPVEFEAFAEAVAQIGLYWLLLNQLPQ
jgi:two-component system, response regulator